MRMIECIEKLLLLQFFLETKMSSLNYLLFYLPPDYEPDSLVQLVQLVLCKITLYIYILFPHMPQQWWQTSKISVICVTLFCLHIYHIGVIYTCVVFRQTYIW